MFCDLSGNSNAQDEKGRATGADEVPVEMLEMVGEVGVKWTGRLLNVCMQEGRIPKEWRMDLIVPIWKRKGDGHDPGKYRGVTLLSQVLKVLERVLDARIRRRVEGDVGEEQQGFRTVIWCIHKWNAILDSAILDVAILNL